MQKPPSTTCTRVFEVFGDRWILRIVDVLRDEPLRFGALQKRLDINTATLTVKLKQLEGLGLVERLEEFCDKQSVAYTLTPRGIELIPIIDQILSFSSKLQ